MDKNIEAEGRSCKIGGVKENIMQMKPSIYFWGCDSKLQNFIQQNLFECYYSTVDVYNPLCLFSDVIVADRRGIDPLEWSEFIDLRYDIYDLPWLILIDEEHYELPLDKRYSRLSTPQEVLGKLVELYNCHWRFNKTRRVNPFLVA